MFFIDYNVYYTFFFFAVVLYIIMVTSFYLYILPQVNITQTNQHVIVMSLNSLAGFFKILALLILIIVNSYFSSIVIQWYDHLFFSAFQLKIMVLGVLFFSILFAIFKINYLLNGPTSYDFINIALNFIVWLLLLFFTNNLFTFFFLVEILTTCLFFFLISSNFLTNVTYQTQTTSSQAFLSLYLPYIFLNMLLFYFWTSLFASLFLYFSLIYFYLIMYTFDWYIFEYVFWYIYLNTSFYNVISLKLVFFFLLTAIFFKCGLAPLFFWKPIFFRSFSLNVLIYYIVIYYFFFYLYLLFFLLVYINEIFYYYIAINMLYIVLGFIFLLACLLNTYQIKSFFALSSIFNSLFVLIAGSANTSIIYAFAI